MGREWAMKIGDMEGVDKGSSRRGDMVGCTSAMVVVVHLHDWWQALLFSRQLIGRRPDHVRFRGVR